MMNKQILTITNGQKLFNIRANNADSMVIYFKDKPLCLVWPDMAGSIGTYFASSNYSSKEIMSHVSSFREFTANGVVTEDNLSKEMLPLLQLFANGKYELEYLEEKVIDMGDFDNEVISYAHKDYEKKYFTTLRGLYPIYNLNLIFITPPSKLDASRVEYYKKEILKGKKPIIIVLQYNQFYFVIDGHHKSKAYGELEVSPAIISIKPVDLTYDKTDHEMGKEFLNDVFKNTHDELVSKAIEIYKNN